MLYSAFQAVCFSNSTRTALILNEESLNYGELWSASDAVAQQLQYLGVQPGDRVCLLSNNSVPLVVCYWAIFKCNAIAVCLNEQLKGSGLQQILEDAKPTLILAATSLIDSLETVSHKYNCKSLETIVNEAVQNQSGLSAVVHPATDRNQIASIIYTSGSTGVPKGVCLTHLNLESVADMAAQGYRLDHTDRYMMLVPLHYIHGLMIMLALLLRGASIEFINSLVFPKVVTQKLVSSGATGFSGVPFHFNALIDRGGFLETKFPQLRWMGVTGGTLAPDRIAQLRHAHPSVELHISYGQTECSPRITLLDPSKVEKKPDSVGAIAPGLSAQILDEWGQDVPVGEIGELVVTGPTVMHGYWDDVDATARVIDQQGRLHTGDLAMIDAEGDVYIKGRMQAMIKSAGERIFPEELEMELNKHPSVQNCAVVGVDDAIYGQRVEAHIQLTEPTKSTLMDIKRHVLRSVPFARAPRRYHAWTDFPIKANGKTDKAQLVEACSEDAVVSTT